MDTQMLPKLKYFNNTICILEMLRTRILLRIGHKIEVQIENEQDYEFVFNDVGGGKKVMAPF